MNNYKLVYVDGDRKKYFYKLFNEWKCGILFIKSLNTLFSFSKKIIKEVVICIWEGQKSVIWLQRILRQGSWKKLQYSLENNNKELWILGNGPSLATQLQEHLDEFLQHDIMCVNHVATAEQFKQLKPKYYVLMDPGFFNQQGLSNEIKDKVKETYDAIHDKVDWHMYFILPVQARVNQIFINYISQNPMVHIRYISTMKFYGYSWLRAILLDKQYCSFGSINVLIPGLYAAIQMGYKNIVLFGAEHSWHNQLYITDNNRVAMMDPHFYGQNEHCRILEDEDIGDVFACMSEAFKSYKELDFYAQKKDICIENATPGSYIDAFRRVNYFDKAD